MKKLKEKKVTIFLIGMILGIVVAGTSAYAAIIYQSSQVSYSNSNSGLSSTNVQGAIDELSTKCSSSSSSGCRIGSYDPIQVESNSTSPLTLVSTRYCTGTGYDDLESGKFSSSTDLVGYIRFDRGMSSYMSTNFDSIYLLDDVGDYYSLNLTMEPYKVVDGGENIDSSNVYRFEIENLPSGDYMLTIDSGVRADNGQYLTGAPIVTEFTVA